MRHFYPDKKCLPILQIVITVITAVLVLALNIYIPVNKVVLIASISLVSLAFIAMFVYLPLFISSIEYTVTDTEIARSSGVFIRFDHSVKFTSIQYHTFIRTPFSDKTGLNFISLFVFGGHLSLLFLDLKDAEEILVLTGSISGGEL